MTSSPQTPADVNGKAHVLLADLANVSLPDDHHHHLGRVLRLRSGDCITATDGRGSWRSAALGTGWPIRAELEWTSEISLAPRRNKLVSVGFALTKGDKPETVVQNLAELGIDRIVLFAAEHSVVRWEPEKASRNIARLQTIAADALQPVRALHPVVFHGQARLAAGATTVAVQWNRGNGWELLRKLQTQPDGSFSFRLRPDRTARYRAAWSGRDRLGDPRTLTSNVVRVAVIGK